MDAPEAQVLTTAITVGGTVAVALIGNRRARRRRDRRDEDDDDA